jgi:hypothetical protein
MVLSSQRVESVLMNRKHKGFGLFLGDIQKVIEMSDGGRRQRDRESFPTEMTSGRFPSATSSPRLRRYLHVAHSRTTIQ